MPENIPPPPSGSIVSVGEPPPPPSGTAVAVGGSAIPGGSVPQSTQPSSNIGPPSQGFATLKEGNDPSLSQRIGGLFDPLMQHLKMGGAAPDERLLAPEKLMSPAEQRGTYGGVPVGPMATGTAEVVGGLTTPGNLALMSATGGLGSVPGVAGKVIPRAASAIFSVQQLKGALEEFPAFKEAIQNKDFSQAERIATHMFWGAVLGAKSGQEAVESGGLFAEAKNKSESVQQIQKQAVGLYTDISQTLNTHQTLLKAQGNRAIEGAIQADNEALRSSGSRGAIPLGAIGDSVWKKIDDLKYAKDMTSADKKTMARLRMDNTITLDEAKALRTDLWDGMKSKDPVQSAIYTEGYARVGNAMRQRISDLEGNDASYNTYNDRHKSAFEMNKGVVGDMLLPALGQDPTNIIKKLAAFQEEKAGVKEIADNQMRAPSMGRPDLAKHLEQSQKDAGILANGYDVFTKSYMGSIIKLFTQHTRDAWPGIAVAMAGYGMGMPRIAAVLAGVGAGVAGVQSATKGRMSKVAGRLEGMPDEAFQTRTPVRDVEDSTRMVSRAAAWPQGREPGAPPAPKTKSEASTTVAPRTSASQAQEIARAKAMKAKGIAYTESEASKAARAQRLKNANKGELKKE